MRPIARRLRRAYGLLPTYLTNVRDGHAVLGELALDGVVDDQTRDR